MNREESLRRIGDRRIPWDVIVIGGGASGLGAAVDAAARGYGTVLLEQHDFAKGTSSRSTKLIHGGVRYLRHGHIALVAEGLRERGLLVRNAPHLVHGRTFVLPCRGWGQGACYAAGLKLYDLLAGRWSMGKSRLLSRTQALAAIPTLALPGLRGGVSYCDGQFDDARLAISLAQTLTGLGGTAVNYLKATGLLKASGQVCGVSALDVEGGTEYSIRGRAVINATGVFCEQVLRWDAASEPLLVLSQGIHLVLDRKFLPGDAALMVPQTDDGRVLFAIPWLDKVLIGTTDTLAGEPSLEPGPLDGEVDFVLRHAARYLDPAPQRADVRSVFAGLRPLAGRAGTRQTSALSRDYSVLTSPSGLVSIIGGKWTIYRRMGEAAVNQAAKVGQLEARPSRTAACRIHGWMEGVDWNEPLSVYGSDAPALRGLIRAQPALGERLHERLPFLKVQIVWGARQEMARTVEDVLARRTRALFLDAQASIEAAPAAAELLAVECEHDSAWRESQVRAYSALAKRYLLD